MRHGTAGARGACALLVGVLACDRPPEVTPPDHEVSMADLTVSSVPVSFADVRDLALAHDGFWVLDSAEPFVTLVSFGDEVLSRFGRSGQGPDELRLPAAIQAADERTSEVFVWDPGNDRVTRYASGGEPISVVRASDGHTGIRSDLPAVTYVDPYRVRRVGDAFAFERYPDGLARTGDLALGRLTVSGRPDLGDGRALRAGDPGSPGRVTGELGALPLWDGCGDASIALWAPDEGRLTWLDPSGGVQRSVTIPHEPRDLHPAEIENYLRLMGRLETGTDPAEQGVDMAVMARSARDLFARRAPLASELRCGSGDQVWLRVFDASSDPLGRGRDWLVTSPSGVTRVRFPEAFSPLLILPDRVVGVLEREEGQRLAWWPHAELPTLSVIPSVE